MFFPSSIPQRGAVAVPNPAVPAPATAAVSAAKHSHELRFVSLFQPGRGVSVPCDASGCVDLDGLTDKLRNAYLGARALVGREYATPQVLVRH